MAGRRHGHRTSENIVVGNFRAGMDGIEVRRSTRRRRSVSARIEQGRIVVFVPAGLSVREERDWVERMVRKLARKNTRASAPDLLERAGQLAAIHLDGATGTQLRPTSVRWVTNMNRRWASCSTDSGEIRLSHRLQSMPSWVVDHVLLHELVHLHESCHGPEFQRLLDADPNRQRAEAYLAGWSAGNQWIDRIG